MSYIESFTDSFESFVAGVLGIGTIIAGIFGTVSPKRVEARRKQRLDILDANFTRSAEVGDYVGMAKMSRQRDKLVRRWTRNAERPVLRWLGRIYVFTGAAMLMLSGFIKEIALDENGWFLTLGGAGFLVAGNIGVDLLLDRHDKSISDEDREMIAKHCELTGISAPDIPVQTSTGKLNKVSGEDAQSKGIEKAKSDNEVKTKSKCKRADKVEA